MKQRVIIKKGDKFGRLTVVKEPYKDEKNKYVCDCICDCGNMKYHIAKSSLTSGRVKSCGCLLKDRIYRHRYVKIGTRFGKLVTISNEISRVDHNGRNVLYIKCKCDCGNIKEFRKGNLISKSSTSCGNCNKIKKGDKFGKLTAISDEFDKIKYNKKILYATFKCECGNIKDIRKTDVINKHVSSCGKCSRKK